MKFNLLKGIWDKWQNFDAPQNRKDFFKWLQDLETFLRRLLDNRISLRENVNCSFVTLQSIPANQELFLSNEEFLPNNPNESSQLKIDCVLIARTDASDCTLTWQQNSSNLLTYSVNTSSVSTINNITFLIVFSPLQGAS